MAVGTDTPLPQPALASGSLKNEKWWTPRIWLGSDFFGLMRLFARNRFRFSWSLVHVAVIDTIFSIAHTALGQVQRAVYAGRTKRAELEPPVIILGHWRSGTTLLHELLILDQRHTFSNTYECLEPNHFLLSSWFVTKAFHWLMPPNRPMDNMALGWESPQEDEFALCNLGVPSPYLTIAFPNEPPQYPEYLDLEGVSAADRERWKTILLRFLKHVTLRRPGRMILKSPPHTARVKILLEMFPDARFINIVRDPYVVFPSTMHLWQRLYKIHGLQVPTYDGLVEHVFETFTRMHDRLEATRHLIPADRYYEVRYEDLVGDMLGQVRSIYTRLDLGDIAPALPALRNYVEGVKDYQTNRYHLAPLLRREISRRWRPFFERYGYEIQPDNVAEE
jgi:omega-hydroxy-beta-dihydromenaquinone-9 sulfotransferase